MYRVDPKKCPTLLESSGISLQIQDDIFLVHPVVSVIALYASFCYMIATIPNIDQYLGKDNIRYKYFIPILVSFSFCSTLMLLEVVGAAHENFAEFSFSIGR